MTELTARAFAENFREAKPAQTRARKNECQLFSVNRGGGGVLSTDKGRTIRGRAEAPQR